MVIPNDQLESGRGGSISERVTFLQDGDMRTETCAIKAGQMLRDFEGTRSTPTHGWEELSITDLWKGSRQGCVQGDGKMAGDEDGEEGVRSCGVASPLQSLEQ